MRLYILAAAAATVAALFAGIAPLGPGRANRRQKVLATLAVLFASIAPAAAVFIGNGLTANARTAHGVALAGPRPGEQNCVAIDTVPASARTVSGSRICASRL